MLRFVLKTKEQRAAEKALLDKSPLKTLTLEEFLESERHKLTGTLTPVTPESFTKWKKDRMDKKAAEEELRKAKEATGRALFESGNWRTLDADLDEADDDEGDNGNEADDDDVWNLDRMRKETEILRAKREEERLASQFGGPVDASVHSGLSDLKIAENDDRDSLDPEKTQSQNGSTESRESEAVPQDEPPAKDAS